MSGFSAAMGLSFDIGVAGAGVPGAGVAGDVPGATSPSAEAFAAAAALAARSALRLTRAASALCSEIARLER